MTRKHFIQIAKILKDFRKTENFYILVTDFTNFCEKANPNFDRNKFIEACGITDRDNI